MKQVTRLFFLGPGEGGEDDGFGTDFQLDRRREKAARGPDRGMPEAGGGLTRTGSYAIRVFPPRREMGEWIWAAGVEKEKGVFSRLSGQLLET